jgi:hypothetical protein
LRSRKPSLMGRTLRNIAQPRNIAELCNFTGRCDYPTFTPPAGCVLRNFRTADSGTDHSEIG